MKKKIFVTAVITTCFALCAAVWPQAETIKEPSMPNESPAVYAPKATVEEVKTTSPTEKEKAETLQQEQIQETAPEQAAEPPVAQTTIEPQSDDMVYVPGFGWLESQGPNHAEYAEDMYENGNKIGIM